MELMCKSCVNQIIVGEFLQFTEELFFEKPTHRFWEICTIYMMGLQMAHTCNEILSDCKQMSRGVEAGLKQL